MIWAPFVLSDQSVGDSDTDGLITVNDAVKNLRYYFFGATLNCEKAADVNDDGAIDIADPVNLLVYTTLGESSPPSPGPFQCGDDYTSDLLTCDGYSVCDEN